MISRMHQKLGTAGFIISIVALVVALGGGAYAASGGLTKKQKKEVEKIAKKVAGKDGKEGPQGPKGDPGAPGAAGKDGTNGTNGKDGVSVTTAGASGAECPTGGVKVTSASGSTPVCNGEEGPEGSPWTAGGTLPSTKTETGEIAVQHANKATSGKDTIYLAIPFTIPLAEGSAIQGGHSHYINPAGNEVVLNGATPEEKASTACLGNAANPKANAGELCVYATLQSGWEPVMNVSFLAQGGTQSFTESQPSSTTGALLSLVLPKETTGKLIASWAVTAP